MAGRDHEDCSQSPISDPLSSPLEDDQGGGGGDHEVLQLRRARRSPPRAIRTTDPSVGVDRVIDGSGGLEAEPPFTVGTMFKSVVNRVPDRPALCYKEGGAWKTISFARYYGLCMAAAKSFVKLGVQPFSGVGLLGSNSPEWLIASLGAIFAGAISAGIYTSSISEACQFVVANCKACVVLVENEEQMAKIQHARHQLPDLKAIVQYNGAVPAGDPMILHWDQFLELGKDVDDSVIEEKIKAQRPEHCALLVYTSGTTGNPKGVMLSHDNLTWMAKCLTITAQEVKFAAESVVSYLPLSHIAAQLSDVYMALHNAFTVYFARPDALKGSLVNTLKEVRPTVFFGVPRVYERIMEQMQEASAGITGFKKTITLWAKDKGIEGNRNREQNLPLPWGWWFADKLLFSKVQDTLGLDRCHIFLSGAAPIREEVVEYFMGVDIPILEIYGMSESTGAHSVNILGGGRWRVGSAGRAVKGAEMKISCPDEKGDGEILFRGRHVFMGYLNSEGKTLEAIDDEGWLHTGDLGRVDKDGFLFVSGRLKEMISSCDGTTISPVVIENAIKKEVPFLNHVMVVGDQRNYLICLVTIKVVVHLRSGEPTDVLSPQAQRTIEQLGSPCTKVSEIIESKDKAVFKAIQDGLDRANKHAISNAHIVQKWSLLPFDFSVSGNELGPTLKLKRQVVLLKYADTIEAMYA